MTTLYSTSGVTKLSREERALRESVQKLREQKNRLQKEMEGLDQVIGDAQKTCAHRAFSDEQGFCYDIRTCGICGASLGLI